MTYHDMTALVVGLGSMGKRRVRNLQALELGRIVGFDLREDRRLEAAEKYGIATVATLDAGLAGRPDVLVISTPPNRHIPYARTAVDAGIPFFMEANCMLDGLADLAESLRARPIVAAPSRTLWFDEGVRLMRRLIDEGALGVPAEFAHHCGHTLLLWHPWEDYRAFYGGQPEARGAGWDMVGFEMYLFDYLFGAVEKVSALYGKRATYDSQIDDTFQVLFQFRNGVLGSAMIDVVSPAAYRTTRIVGEQGVIEWDNGKKQLDLFRQSSGAWETFRQEPGHILPGYVAAEEMYIAEMDAFCGAAAGGAPYVATFDEEVRLMQVVEGVRLSRESGRHICFD